MFPPLAVLIGAQLARAQPCWMPTSRACATFRGLCGLHAAAALVAVLRPGLIRDPAAALALRPYAYALTAVLVAGAIFVRRPAGVVPIAIAFLAGLILAEPLFPLRGSKPLALQVAKQALPGDLVYHYHEFFHDFTFYAGRTVGLVSFKGELEPENDPAAAARTRIDDAEFRRQWSGPARIFTVARKKDVTELFSDPGFLIKLLGETPDYYLFSNRP